jgi:hypothetical protein
MSGTALTFLLLAWGIILGTVAVSLVSLVKHEKK